MHKANRDTVKQVKNLLMKPLSNHFPLPVGARSPYDSALALTVLVMSAMRHTFLEGICRIVTEIWNKKIPSSDTILRYLKKMKSDEVKDRLKKVNNESILRARRMRVLTHAVVCAVDCNDKEYYGKIRDSSLMVRGPFKNGTSWFYRIATICVVEHGIRFEIAAEEYTVMSSLEKVLAKLLDEALSHARIRILLLDRGFDSAAIRNLLEDRGIKYVMSVQSNDRIAREVEETKGSMWRFLEWTVEDKKRKRVNSMILMILDMDLLKPSKDPFAISKFAKQTFWIYGTNLSVNSENIISIAREYDARWGIETGYRVDEHEFFGKTTSRNASVRLFYLYLAIALRNFWVLYQLICGCGLKNLKQDKSNRIPALDFKEEFIVEFLCSE